MGEAKNNEEEQKVVELFQKLREEQGSIVTEISRIEEEEREHERVLKLLGDVDDKRICHQLVSDSLVEMKVFEVLPILQNTLANLKKVKDSLNESLVGKGKELNDHKAKHNIRFLSEKEAMQLRQQQMQAMTTQKK